MVSIQRPLGLGPARSHCTALLLTGHLELVVTLKTITNDLTFSENSVIKAELLIQGKRGRGGERERASEAELL